MNPGNGLGRPASCQARLRPLKEFRENVNISVSVVLLMDISSGKYILEFCSERCVACKTVEAIMNKLMKDYDDITLVKIDVRKNRDIARKFGVIALPVLVFIKDGVEVDRIKGARTEKELREFIERNR